MIEIQKLVYFIAIVDNNFSLSKASKDLNITQPTLSLTIDTLEEYYNTKLLEKEKNKFVRLTWAGRLLYDDATKLVEHSNQTYLKITNPNDFIGELNIAIPPVTQPIVTPQVLVQFKKKYPNIKVNIFEDGAYIAKGDLLDGKLDFGFLTLFESDSEIEGFEVYESDVVVIFREDHPLSNMLKISCKEVNNFDIIGLDKTFSLYRMIDIYFQNNDTPINYFLTSSRWDYIVEMVATNNYDFVAILPEPILDIYKRETITYRHFDHQFVWKVALSYKKDRLLRKECLLFIDFVKDFFNITK